jgi:hypothetical protein
MFHEFVNNRCGWNWLTIVPNSELSRSNRNSGCATKLVLNFIYRCKQQSLNQFFFLIGVRQSNGTAATVWPIVPDPDDR